MAAADPARRGESRRPRGARPGRRTRHVGDALAYAPHLPDARLAALVRGARAAILPVLSEAAGFAAIDALAVRDAGRGVRGRRAPGARRGGRHPRPAARAGRLAAALQTVWTDRRVHARIAGEARARAADRRTWAEVAAATRRVYAEVGATPDPVSATWRALPA